MKDFKYKFVGNYNINTLIELLNNKSGNDWDFWNRKQGRFQAHSETKTIPLLLDEGYGYTGEVKGDETKFYSEFKAEISNIKNVISKKYGDGDVLGIEIAKLPKKSQIYEHKDYGISLSKNPRVHLVLSTNSDVTFKVDGESKNMKAGEMWEINNSSLHSVNNNGDTDRIHMVIDYKPVIFTLL